MNDRKVRRPIIVIGTPRSGTTLVGSLLTRHPDVAYREEPRTIWSLGNAWKPDDCLDAAHLTPGIARRIDNNFASFLETSGRPRFAEKTPSNCLRIGFIHSLYPDARIVHMVRDGRAVVASMLKKLATPPRRDRVLARMRETPLREYPAQLPLVFRELARLASPGATRSWWGPRPPDWKQYRDLPTVEMLACQWRDLLQSARRDLTHFPADQQIEIRYEDLANDPLSVLEKIRTVTDLAPYPESFGPPAADGISSAPSGRWKTQLDADTIRAIDQRAGELLRELSYH